jgi:hypothetical protein
MTAMFHRHSKAWRLVPALAVAALTQESHGAEPAPARDLSTFFKLGVAVLDTNGDSLASRGLSRVPPST